MALCDILPFNDSLPVTTLISVKSVLICYFKPVISSLIMSLWGITSEALTYRNCSNVGASQAV